MCIRDSNNIYLSERLVEIAGQQCANFLSLQVVSVVVPGTERVRPQHDTSLYFCSKRLVARPLVHLGKRASLLGTVSVANTIETRQIRRRFSSCNDVIRRDGIFLSLIHIS